MLEEYSNIYREELFQRVIPFWLNYSLDQEGKKTHSLKGGPYKGCFHLPRFLLYAVELLEKELHGFHEGGGKYVDTAGSERNAEEGT